MFLGPSKTDFALSHLFAHTVTKILQKCVENARFLDQIELKYSGGKNENMARRSLPCRLRSYSEYKHQVTIPAGGIWQDWSILLSPTQSTKAS